MLRYLEPNSDAPQTSSTSHFAWSLDRRYAYFHQSLLERDRPGAPVREHAVTPMSASAIRTLPIKTKQPKSRPNCAGPT